MKEYAVSFGFRIRLIDLLNGSNKRIADLPTMADYAANGRPYICWAHVLGRCTYPNCQYKKGHVPRSAITNSFADEVVAIITPGVKALLADGKAEGPQGKRFKTEGRQE